MEKIMAAEYMPLARVEIEKWQDGVGTLSFDNVAERCRWRWSTTASPCGDAGLAAESGILRWDFR
jgi:hypothetical protein